jgi:hypothetical protein
VWFLRAKSTTFHSYHGYRFMHKVGFHPYKISTWESFTLSYQNIARVYKSFIVHGQCSKEENTQYFLWIAKDWTIWKIIMQIQMFTNLSYVNSVSKQECWGGAKSLTCTAIRAQDIASHTAASKWANCVVAGLATYWACLIQTFINILTAVNQSSAVLVATD